MVLVKAIYDYNGSQDHKIQFTKGDTFELVDDTDPNWWHVILPRVGDQIPEHIYVPATYVTSVIEEEEDEIFIDDLPPPPTEEELATLSSSNLGEGAPPPPERPEREPASVWKTHTDNTGRTYYFNVETQTSQWKKPDELKSAEDKENGEERIYASLLPKETSSELRKPVNAASAGTNMDYQNMDYQNNSPSKPHYMNLAGARDNVQLTLQTAGQTTCNENTQRDRKHSSPSTTSPSPNSLTSSLHGSLPRDSVLTREGTPIKPKRNTSPRPYSIAVSSTIPVSPTHKKAGFMKRQLSDHQLSPPKIAVPSVFNRRSLKKQGALKRRTSTEMTETTLTTSVEHGNSAFHDGSLVISAPIPTVIPKQILEGYTEDRCGGEYFYICKNTNEKWKLIRNDGDDKTHYLNQLTGERVWSLPVYRAAVNRTFSSPHKQKHPKALDRRSKSLSDYNRDKSPSVKCEGTLKRKITQAPLEVKVEKSWSYFYTVLKSNTIYFFKDIKHYKRNEFESACDLTDDAKVYSDADKKGIKLIKISKDNGLEMLLRVKDETGTKQSSFEHWLEHLSGCTSNGLRSAVSASHLPDANGIDGDVDQRSIIGSKEITKKDINEFLNKKIQKENSSLSNNKSSIQKLLEDQGIDISHLDKSKKKEVLNKLLSARPSFSELEKLGLIKYTVFGCPLGKLCVRQKTSVPRVVTQCIEAIEFRGLKSSGIYRISGNSASIQKLRYKVDREEHVNLKDQEYDINMLTGFMKLFLRELPEPVIPFNQYPIVEKAIRDHESGRHDETVPTLKKVVQNLPEPNRSTFKYIILHLVRVANDEENQMDEHNLSIIFGPSLLGNHPDHANLLVDLPIQNKAIDLIICNYKTIFR